MFPVAELSNLNSDDFSFLDDVCLLEDNHFDEIKNMANFNFIENMSFPEQNMFSEDQLSENVQLDDLIEMSSFHQIEDLNYISMGISSSTNPECIKDSSTDILEAYASVDEPIQIGRLNSEELYSSSDEGKTQLDMQDSKSSLVSENEDTSFEQNVKDPFVLAGKKYLKMREKNNVASQRSRKLRKQKNVEMIERLKELEVENEQLSLLVTKLEAKRDALHRQLLHSISKK